MRFTIPDAANESNGCHNKNNNEKGRLGVGWGDGGWGNHRCYPEDFILIWMNSHTVAFFFLLFSSENRTSEVYEKVLTMAKSNRTLEIGRRSFTVVYNYPPML